MNDIFRAIFGIPGENDFGERMDDRLPKNHRDNFKRNMGGDDDDDGDDDDNFVNMNPGSRGGIFGFPMFNEPFEIHKHFDRLVTEMNKAFGVFGFSNGPSISWEDENSNSSSFYKGESEPRPTSLRDAYLKKPDCNCDSSLSNDNNLIVNTNLGDVEPGTSNSIQSFHPKIYSKSVFIQTTRKPDGSVETIKKITDHEGNEQTIISQSNVNDPLPPSQEEDPLLKKDDTSGISILKKFFSF